ncbi:MAG: triple tyrosine motif-containing protein, partial [Bacteroidota bacterium]
SSYKGILKYQVEDSTGTVYYTSNVGGSDLNNPSPVVVKGDNIYFAGSQGITKLDTRRAIAHPTTKPVKFTSLAVNDEPYQSTLSEGDIRLSHRRNDVEATYSNFDFINPDAVTYEYRLLPRDDDWIKNGKDQKVSFYNLSPDDYTLEVKGSNSDGIMHPEVAQLSFTIVPPWWATWWARISALGLVVGGILLTQREVYHGRLRRQKRIEMLRTKISHDLHDDVGSLLTGVAMQSELLELSLSDDKKNLAHQIADQSRTAIARMRDTVWAMDASKDTYADLEDRVHDHLHDVLGQREIQYDTDFTAAPSQERIDPDVRQVLYLICKESITNIAKHSTTDRVMLKVEKGKSHLSLFIKDSGEEKSFLKTSGIGLNSMKQRAESVGGTYSFGYNRVGYVTKVEIPLT